jgi:hypothetical protein
MLARNHASLPGYYKSGLAQSLEVHPCRQNVDLFDFWDLSSKARQS